jgi:hypothetical protein
MSNGDDWADISDGGDDDWEMGKPVAPGASGSSSGSFGSGSNGSVSAASRSHHRPQSSWGADDDWGGDEENWHPGPANPSLSNLRGSRATPPRSPALTKGVSPARPAKGNRRWTRSRAACRRLGVLACLVAAVVTLSSFGIFKGGGSRDLVSVDAWETRPEGDAFERTARSFEEERWISDDDDDAPETSSRARDETRFRAAPAETRETRAPVSETVFRRVPIGTMTDTTEDAPSSRRVSDELARLKRSHEHVSNAADATDVGGVVAPAFPDSEETAERSDERSDARAASRSEPDSALVPIETGTEVATRDEDEDAIEADGNAEDTLPSDGALDDVATEAEDDAADDAAADDVFGEVVDAEEDEAPRDAREAPIDAEDGSRDGALVSPRDVETGAATSTVVFGEVVDGGDGDDDGGASTLGEENASSADADFSVSAEAFAGAFGDTREEASVNDADFMTTPNDEASEATTEEAGDETSETSDTTERHEDDTKGFGSVEETSLVEGSPSSTNAVASERAFPNKPPPPPPVPMDGPDMTDPANRARLDAYQSRAKYVEWSKKTAKLEGRVVAPPDAETRR